MLPDKIDIQHNHIISGDNMEWLPLLPDGSVDLCYIDPPFFSNKNYETIWGNSYEMRSFGDRFAGGIRHYVAWMRERIVFIHKKLKDTGSFYLHCDWHASHYLKIACDEIFGEENFRNEIIWRYRRWPAKSRNFQRMHDAILWYSKSDGWTWNQLYEEKSASTLKAFGDTKLTTEITERGTVKKVRTDQKSLGTNMSDVWEIPVIQGSAAKERIGYNTQKPEALLKRIILAGSAKDDLVLDCFAGGGTTAKVCADLGRRFICGDVSPVAVRVIAARLNKYRPETDYKVLGLPQTEKELKALSGHEFAELVCQCKGWDVNQKKSGDEGIDGWANNKQVPIQIKNHAQPVGRPDIQKFVGAMRGQKEGLFVAWNFSKQAMEFIAKN